MSPDIDDFEDESENFDPIKCFEFERLTNSKINQSSLNVEETVAHKKFISIADNLICKFPYLIIDEFIEEYVDGVYNKFLIKKYNFSRKSNYEKCLRSFNLPQKREKYSSESNTKSDYPHRKNLKNTNIFTSYNFLKSQCEYFKDELIYLFNYNHVRAVILINFLMKKTSINDIILNKKIYDTDKFEYFNLTLNEPQIEILKNKFDDFLIELYRKNMITYSYGEYTMEITFQDIEKSIKKIVEDAISGISYANIASALIKTYNFISIIPHYDFLNNILSKNVNLGFFKIETGFRNSDKTEHRYFTITNHQNQKLVSLPTENSPFYGRQNDPHQFIQDIKYLRKGDFDDEDDQVTRIAGLILAGTQNMVSETEDFSQFDFAVSMTGFNPTEEQLKIMAQSKLVLLPKSKIIHISVMINDEVKPEMIKSIQNILPENQQAIIISFQDVSDEITSLISNDHMIQIIDKKVLQLWAEITPEIPCRKGAVTKIMQGQYIGKIGRLNNIDYSTGKATVKIIGDDEEKTVYIGHLKEINLFDDPILDEHLLLSTNYFEFLNILEKKSNNIEFDKALFNQEDNCDKFIVRRDDWVLKSGVDFLATYDQINCRIIADAETFENKFYCSCEYFKNEHKFCFHLISILNEIGIRCNLFTETWNSNENILFKCLSNL